MPVSSAPPTYVDTPETRRELERLEMLATWLDRRYLDPLLGFFFPGPGDTLPSLLGLYGVYVAAKLKIHPIVLARMLVNLGIDAIVGGIPFLGVIFDIFYRAHVRNLELIRERGSHGEPTTGDWLMVGGAALLFLAAMLLPFLVIGALLVLLFSIF